jgi:hypothetical protein
VQGLLYAAAAPPPLPPVQTQVRFCPPEKVTLVLSHRNYALENAMEAANLPLVELLDR